MKSIHELREEQIVKLTSMDPDHDAAKARRIMNSFYRFAAFEERVFLDDNEEETCHSASHQRDIRKEQAWYERLDKQLLSYGLRLYCSDGIPKITNMLGNKIVIQGEFYD